MIRPECFIEIVISQRHGPLFSQCVAQRSEKVRPAGLQRGSSLLGRQTSQQGTWNRYGIQAGIGNLQQPDIFGSGRSSKWFHEFIHQPSFERLANTTGVLLELVLRPLVGPMLLSGLTVKQFQNQIRLSDCCRPIRQSSTGCRRGKLLLHICELYLSPTTLRIGKRCRGESLAERRDVGFQVLN